MSRPRVAILISGSGSNMVSLVKDMQAADYAEPILVLSNKASAGGLEKAEALGIPTQTVPSKGRAREEFEADLDAALREANPDVICLAGFMRVLNAAFVRKWEGKMLNIHPSLLPKYKGLHTHARAIEAGDAVHGCTVHLVTPELDDGPILGQAEIPIEAGDTPDSLAAKLLPHEHRLYPAMLRKFLAK
ncbi:phosphoribosylglycinamide formyltransferase [Paracoccaceae bacterium GXU_MW_L88]